MTTHLLQHSSHGPRVANGTAALVTWVLAQRCRVQEWAWLAAVRLSDQNKPMVLKLLVECAICVAILTRLTRSFILGKRNTAQHSVRRAAQASRARGRANARSARPCGEPTLAITTKAERRQTHVNSLGPRQLRRSSRGTALPGLAWCASTSRGLPRGSGRN